MHIVMVTIFPSDPNHIGGGVAGVARYLADELTKNEGVKLTIVVPRGKTGETVRETWTGYEVYRLGQKNKWRFLPGLVYDLFVSRRQFRKLFETIKPDVVHYQGLTSWALGSKFPYVVSIHGIPERTALWSARPVLRWGRWLSLKIIETVGRYRAKNIIVTNKYVEDFLRKDHHKQQRWPIENPVDNSYFDLDWDYEPYRIFYCGRVTPLKNILGLLKAFVPIAQEFPDATLRIVGNDESNYLKVCKKFVKDNSLDEKVFFFGSVDNDSVQHEFAKANCFVLPSFQETAPVAIEEAMAVGVPVVASDLCGLPYMVENGNTGFLVDPYDESKITEAIKKIISNPQLAQKMSQRAKEIANARFRASYVATETLKVYQNIIQTNS